MTESRIILFPFTPWTLRVFKLAPASPFLVGISISAAWFVFYLLYSWSLGDGPGHLAALSGGSWPSEIGWSLIIGMAPAVTAASLRGAARDLEDLAPALAVESQELEGLQREIATVPHRRLTLIGVGSAVATVFLMMRTKSSWVGGDGAAWSDPAVLWFIARNVVNWWMISRAIAIEVSLARAFSRLGERLSAVDVLDRVPLAPFGRRSLRSVLLWMLYLSLFSLQYVLGSAQPILGLGILMIVFVSIAAFLLPVWGAHVHLREAKSVELARVHERLATARDRTLDAPPDEVAGGRLADLVAWEQRVSAASEWPFGSSTVLRFALYTAIGLGSWLGAAFVERLLESVLG